MAMTLERVENPPNPYQSHHLEWLEPPPPTQIEVYHDASRSVIAENNSLDVGFRWSITPYRGC